MKICRLDLDGAGSPGAIVERILSVEPDLPIPVPLEALCAAFDIVSIADIDTNAFEAALLTNALKVQGAILVRRGRRISRRRFSIAHELGHFLIPAHLPTTGRGFECSAQDLTVAWSREQSRTRRMEAEANSFAALLLMPPVLLREMVRAERNPDLATVSAIAERFAVSIEAAARAYVEQQRACVAIVIGREGKLVRAYRGRDFPWLDLTKGRSLTETVSAARALPSPGFASETRPANMHDWLSADAARGVDELTEQHLQLGRGYTFTLLHALLRDEDDDPATDHRWSPRF